ncbi:hypothetical protein K438DRAFT_2014092 [Mycena galopus ATCC 62051]|nr:hypothetical protein K438DRAFT_2014092 [Mycena galopus ATCC 62051]
MQATLTTDFDFSSEFQRLSKPVLDDGHHVLGLASDSCVWPGISPPFAIYLAGLGAPAVVVSSLKTTNAVVLPSTANPVIPLVTRILSTLLGTDPEDYIYLAGPPGESVSDESQYADPLATTATDLAHIFQQRKPFVLLVAAWLINLLSESHYPFLSQLFYVPSQCPFVTPPCSSVLPLIAFL